MENMDKNMQTIAALKLCATTEVDDCDNCPYSDRTNGAHTCRAWLCLDAAEALAAAVNHAQAMSEEVEDMANERTDLLNKLNDMQKKLAEKQTSVCSDAEGLREKIKALEKGLYFQKGISQYYQGQADALKWFINFYLSPQNTLEARTAEVPDDV